MGAERRRVLAVAGELRIFVEADIRANELRLGFRSHTDAIRLRLAAFGREGFSPGVHRYRHRFVDSDPINAWTAAACSFLREQGIDYRVEHETSARTFVFSDPYAHAMFTEMATQGVFIRSAEEADRRRQRAHQDRVRAAVETYRSERAAPEHNHGPELSR